MQKYISKIDSKLKELETQMPSNNMSNNVLAVMHEISTRLPPKQDVNFETTEFVFAENFVRLNATTTDTLNVEKIVDALRKSAVFGEISPSDAQPKPGGKWDFTIKIDFK